MKHHVLSLTVLSVLFGCAAAPPRQDGTSILHPHGLSLEQRKTDLSECYQSALNDFRVKPLLKAPEKAPLQGRATARFFKNGHPVINSEYTPNTMTTLLSGVLAEQDWTEVTDRYVLCFLSRGYIWPTPKVSN